MDNNWLLLDYQYHQTFFFVVKHFKFCGKRNFMEEERQMYHLPRAAETLNLEMLIEHLVSCFSILIPNAFREVSYMARFSEFCLLWIEKLVLGWNIYLLNRKQTSL